LTALTRNAHLDIFQFRILWHSVREKLVVRLFPEPPLPKSNSTHSSNVLTTLKTVTTISTALYPCVHRSFSFSSAVSMSPFRQARMVAWMMMGWGWSQTLKTLSPETKLKPECVDCRLLMACRISPSEVKIRAVRPSSVYSTCAMERQARWNGLEVDIGEGNVPFPFHKSPTTASIFPHLWVWHIEEWHSDFGWVRWFCYSCCMLDRSGLCLRRFP